MNSYPMTSEEDASDQVIQAVLTMAEMAPQNATEAMLAVQMIAANDAALLFLRRATADGQTVEGSDGNVLRATPLMSDRERDFPPIAAAKSDNARVERWGPFGPVARAGYLISEMISNSGSY